MDAFTSHRGIIGTLDRANVDTDQIIPKQFLKSIKRTGYGEQLFFDWRYLPDGKSDPSFELNQPKFKNASILVTRNNFACGSSREHAVWALTQYGLRAIIAPRMGNIPAFADIFHNNCFQNGILPIKVSPADLEKLMDDANRGANATITVDLEKQEIRGPDGGVVRFDIDPFRKRCLLEGLDNIGLTMQEEKAITAFEQRTQAERPWL